MLIILPAAILIVTISLMAVMQRRDVGRGLIWSAGAVGSLATIIVSLILAGTLPLELVIRSSSTSIFSRQTITLILDGTAWAFQTALLAVLTAVLLTATRRQDSRGPSAWLASLGIAVLGLIAIQAGTISTLLSAWFLIDTLELAFILLSLKPHQGLGKLAASFALRYTGILVALVALITFEETTTINAGTYMLLAVMLRLGALPFWPYWGEPGAVTGLGMMMQAVRVLSALTPLARLGTGTVPSNWTGLFTLYCMLLMLYCAMSWLKVTSIQNGRVYWITGYNLAACACVIHDQSGAAVPWIVAAMLIGSSQFLITDRSRLSISLTMASLVALTGLPYTPVSSGWSGLLGAPVDWRATPFLLANMLFLAGSLRLALKTPEPGSRIEGLARFAYPAGLILLLIMPWVIMLVAGNETPLQDWWAGFVTFALLLIIIIIFRAQLFENATFKWPDNRFWNVTNKLSENILSAIRQDWLITVFYWFSTMIGRIVGGISDILEGDGGVLWVFLLLTLFATLISSAGGL
jgi:hypothetical protein